MNAGDEIRAAYGRIAVEDALEIAIERYRAAKAVVATIPSGTRDENLTPTQLRALNVYEETLRQMQELREERA